MIKLITGVPRSGKTYLSIKLLIDEFFYFNKELQEYKKKKKYKDTTIVTNIDGFFLHDYNLDAWVESSKLDFKQFFTVPYQERITKKYGKIIYVIDECQRFIGPYFRDQETIYYFDWHGHFEHEIFLISQHRKKICFQIYCLAEFEYRAVKRTLTIFGELKYNILSDGEIFERKSFKPDQKIYSLYKSSTNNVAQKTKNPVIRTIAILLVLLCFSACLLKRQFSKPSRQVNAESVSANAGYNDHSHNTVSTKPTKISIIEKSTDMQNNDGMQWVETSAIIKNYKPVSIYNPITEKLEPRNIYQYKVRTTCRYPRFGLINIYTYVPLIKTSEAQDDRNNFIFR